MWDLTENQVYDVGIGRASGECPSNEDSVAESAVSTQSHGSFTAAELRPRPQSRFSWNTAGASEPYWQRVRRGSGARRGLAEHGELVTWKFEG